MTASLAGGTFEPLVAAALARRDGGAWAVEPDHGPWLLVRHRDARLPEQGWKLHISADVASAPETLRRALDVLLAETLAFKVAASPDVLMALNEGHGSVTQVGKFITVYPADDDQAVRLAAALGAASAGLRGPPIPSDRPLRDGSVVHYRYGSFGGRTMQRLNGEVVFAMLDPSGQLVPDVRSAAYAAPAWTVDPFLAAGVAEPLSPPSPLVGGRYLRVGPLALSARGGVYVAVDLDQPGTVVLKKAAGRNGDGAGLRHEAEVLARLAPTGAAPVPHGLVSDGDDLYLAMEDATGHTLEAEVTALNRAGKHVPNERLLAWARQLAGILSSIHGAGLVYRDLKSTNVVVAGDGLRLVDFELAIEPGGPGAVPGLGTRGYISPQQAAGHPPAFTDDVYGYGAVLYYLATGAEPSQAPDPSRLLDRPVAALNPEVDPAVEAVVVRCLCPEAGARLQTMADVIVALSQPARLALPPGPEPDWLDLCRRLGDTLCELAVPTAHGPGLTWTSSHPLTLGVRARDLNAGAAGTVLALAEVVDELGDSRHRATLAGAVDALLAGPAPAGSPLPGLYVGEAGVAAAVLRAGQVLGEPALIEAASARGRRIAGLEHRSPDLFNGSAGRLRFHLMLWDETAEDEHLSAAVAAGEWILAGMEDASGGGRRWTIPAGYDGLSGHAYLGYAHGAAGIADALLDLYDTTGDGRYAAAARGAAVWLKGLGVPVLDEDTGTGWPATPDEGVAAAHWCHGSAGIARFWLHAAELQLLPECDAVAQRALDAVAHGTRWAPPPQCHGLAGGIEVLLDAHQAGDGGRLEEAMQLGRLLLAFALEGDGLLRWPSENPLVVSPDYMVGYAGVLATLLRLADPSGRPHGLSRKGFRHRSRR